MAPKAQLRKLFSVLMLFLVLLFTGCASYKPLTKYSYSSPIIPQWFNKLALKPKTVAIIPFEGYDFRTKGIASNIESKLRTKLKEWGEYNLIERHHLSKVLTEQSFGLTGLTNQQLVEIGKMLSTNILLFGLITDYSEEENYVETVDKVSYAADEYSRTTSLALNLRIISVETGEIIYDKENRFSSKSIGYRNIRKKDTTKNDDNVFVGLSNLFGEIGEELSNERSKLPKMEEYSALREKCNIEVIEYFFPDLVSHKKCYQENYKVDKKGNEKYISKSFYSIVPSF